MSLRITPAPSYPSQLTQPGPSAPSAPGVYDTLRARAHASTAAAASSKDNQKLQSLKSSHPLEARLAGWVSTREQLKSTLLRRQYGLAAPVQRSMELLSVERGGWDVMPGLYGGGRSVHADVLMGRDWEVDGWEDVYSTAEVGYDGEFDGWAERRVAQW